ncbi:MAG: NRAMP family divalent metal transporter [Ilumatobacteraceae bacterium]
MTDTGTGSDSTHHHRRHSFRGAGYFKRLGPGLITGAADDDPSGIGTYSQVGAATGLGLVWTTVVALPLASAVQEATARLGLVTDRGLAALIKIHFSRKVLMLAVLLVTAANTFNIGADIGSMAAATRLIVPIPNIVLVLAFTALMASLEVIIPYRRYSKVLRWLCLSIVAYILVLFTIDVSWSDVAFHTFVPHLEFTRAEIAAMIAIFGTTISPYLFFWQSGEEVEEITASHGQLTPTPAHMRAMRGDVFAGMGSGVTVMFAIMVTAAATLGAKGSVNISTAEQAADALRPLAGDMAGLLFTIGIVGTGLLAIPVLAGSTAYAVSEAFGWKEGLGLKLSQAKAFYLVIIGSMIGGLCMNLFGLNAVRALYFSAILNGLAAPPLILLVWLLARSEKVLGEHRSGWLSQSGLLAAAVISGGLPILLLVAR